jgi:GTP-binding protein Era
MRSGFVSLIGRPNAGKSTLLNRFVGTKLSIVSDKPQTTRNQILGVKNLAGDVSGQIVFVDTPGIHRPLHRMNVRMVDLALDTLGKVDVLVVVIDASTKTGAGDRYLLTLLKHIKVPVVLALNKIDLIAKHRLLPLIDWYRQQRDFVAMMPVSALTGDGQEELERAIVELMPEGDPLYPDDYLTDQPERVLAAETVREKVLMNTRAELPFSTAVVVDRFEEPGRDGDAILRIYCSILVERETQKRIVVGRGGALIKKIGIEAREDLEAFFATRVYLDLHVRVRAGWRDNERILSELGITRRS